MRTRHLAALSFVLAVAVACAMGPMAAQSAAPAAAQAAQAAPAAPASVDLKMPNKKGTVKFGVIGDNGTGEREQYEIAGYLMVVGAVLWLITWLINRGTGGGRFDPEIVDESLGTSGPVN